MDGVGTILNLVGSVALLLWGVRMVRTGLTRAFGAAWAHAMPTPPTALWRAFRALSSGVRSAQPDDDQGRPQGGHHHTGRAIRDRPRGDAREGFPALQG